MKLHISGLQPESIGQCLPEFLHEFLQLQPSSLSMYHNLLVIWLYCARVLDFRGASGTACALGRPITVGIHRPALVCWIT
jgi:hypothetical protein